MQSYNSNLIYNILCTTRESFNINDTFRYIEDDNVIRFEYINNNIKQLIKRYNILVSPYVIKVIIYPSTYNRYISIKYTNRYNTIEFNCIEHNIRGIIDFTEYIERADRYIEINKYDIWLAVQFTKSMMNNK